MTAVERLMQAALDEQVFPGAVLLVSRDGDIRWELAGGRTDLNAGGAVTSRTVFDLASLTKPLATTPAVMELCRRGRLALDARLDELLPTMAGRPQGAITVEQLLRHTSGYPDYRPYYQRLNRVPTAARVDLLHALLAEEEPVAPPGRDECYSDVGFLVLQWVVETLTGVRLDRFAADAVWGPAELDGLFFVDLAQPRPALTFAATEKCPWRGRVLSGVVHDDNAYAMGGIAGHAGLFGTARAVHRLLARLLAAWNGEPGSGWLDPALVRQFLQRPPGAGRALGFDVPATLGSSAGNRFSRLSVGHLGFTGTSFWIDLERAVIVVLLTNRVHPSRDNDRIREFRPRLHDVVMDSL